MDGGVTDDPQAAATGGSERPVHVEESVRALASLHDEHHGQLPPLGRALDMVTAAAGRPWFVIGLLVVIVGWIGLNLAMAAAGAKPLDAPPFGTLQTAGTVFALLMTCLILSTQRREDLLAAKREQLTLELCLLAEQKASKTIELLEALRRDTPFVSNRSDDAAASMSTPSDPRMILDAIQDARPDLNDAMKA